MDTIQKTLMWIAIFTIPFLLGNQLGNWKGRQLEKEKGYERCSQITYMMEIKMAELEAQIEAYEKAFDYKIMMEQLGLWKEEERRID